MKIQPTFGSKKENQDYILRPSCYAVIFNSYKTKVAIIKKEHDISYLEVVWSKMKQVSYACTVNL